LHNNGSIDLEFQVVVTDSVELNDSPVESSGSATTSLDSYISATASVTIDIVGVADDAIIDTSNSNWNTNGTNTFIASMVEGGAILLDLEVLTGEAHDADGNLQTPDGSERVTVLVSNVPDDVTIVDGAGITTNLVFAGYDSNGQPSYQVDVDNLDDIFVISNSDSSEDFDFTVTIVTTENDGSVQSTEYTMQVEVSADVYSRDMYGTNYGASLEGLEDTELTIDWVTNDVRGWLETDEQITEALITGIPEGGSLFLDGNDINTIADAVVTIDNGTYSITLTGAALDMELSYLPPADSDADFVIETQVTVYQADHEGVSANDDTKIWNGTLNVNIVAAADDGETQIDQDGDGNEDSVLDIDHATLKITDVLTFTNLDTDSIEDINSLVISGLPDGYIVIGGLSDGEGNWFVSDINSAEIKAPDGVMSNVEDIYLTIEVIDAGDTNDSPQDASDPSFLQLGPLSLNVDTSSLSGGSSAPVASTASIPGTITIDGAEDAQLNLAGALIANINFVDDGDSANGLDYTNDSISLVINNSDLPEGTELTGFYYNYQSDTWITSLRMESDGSIDYPSHVGISLPEDFAGELTVAAQIITTDSISNDSNEATVDLQFNVTPEVEATQSMSINIVGSDFSNIPAEEQPESGDSYFAGEALEDAVVEISIEVSLGDSNIAGQGIESLENISLTSDADFNFVDADGNAITSSISVDPSQIVDLGNGVYRIEGIYIQSEQDYSGDITNNLSLNLSIIDTASSGTDIADSITLIDGINFDSVTDQTELNVTNLSLAEDTSISLAGNTITLGDTDGSEVIESIVISGIPEGFNLVADAGYDIRNNGDGEWTITTPSGFDPIFALDLDFITLVPPANFSGSLDINFSVFTSDIDELFPQETSATINVTVTPKADAVNVWGRIDGATNEAKENTAHVMQLGMAVTDAVTSAQGNNNTLQEGDAETLIVTISGVPTGATIELPDGVAMGSSITPPTATTPPAATGTWTAVITATELDSLIYNANNTNGDVELTITVQADDNGDTDASLITTVTYSVKVEAENDAPEVDAGVAPQTATTDNYFEYAVRADAFSDADIAEGDSLSYSATMDDGSALPNWLIFSNGVFSGTPTDSDASTLSIELTATDSEGASASLVFTLDVHALSDDSTIVGTDGADTITGGSGSDTLDGGDGADTYLWLSGDHGTAADMDTDTIKDFDILGGDNLDLSGLLEGQDLTDLSKFIVFDADNNRLLIDQDGDQGDGFNATLEIILEGADLSTYDLDRLIQDDIITTE